MVGLSRTEHLPFLNRRVFSNYVVTLNETASSPSVLNVIFICTDLSTHLSRPKVTSCDILRRAPLALTNLFSGHTVPEFSSRMLVPIRWLTKGHAPLGGLTNTRKEVPKLDGNLYRHMLAVA